MAWVVNGEKTHALVYNGQFIKAGEVVPVETIDGTTIAYWKREKLVVPIGDDASPAADEVVEEKEPEVPDWAGPKPPQVADPEKAQAVESETPQAVESETPQAVESETPKKGKTR